MTTRETVPWGKVLAVPDPAARKALEQALLAKHQGILQNIVLQSMPIQHSLMEQAPASGGGDLSLGLGDVAGSGQRYSTEEVVLPEQMQKLLERPGVGPGSFEVADGQISAVDGVGLDTTTRQDMRDAAQRGGQWLADHGLIPGGEAGLSPEQMSTHAANLAVPSAPGMVMPGASGAGGAAPGGLPAAPGILSPVGVGTGIPRAAGAAGATTGAGALGMRGGLHGAVPGAAGAAGIPGGAVPRAGGNGIGAGSGIGGAHGANPAHPQANKAGVGASQAGRGMAPMMGMHRGGNVTKDSPRAVRAVITEVEKDPNRLALLGQRPAVVPGVIGAWVRED